jgi:hypothetical protein
MRKGPGFAGLFSYFVMRGLDPRIHQSSQESFEERWITGSSPAMMK